MNKFSCIAIGVVAVIVSTFIAAAVLLVGAEESEAQSITPILLIGDSYYGPYISTDNKEYAQPFRTGSNFDGYVLTKLHLVFKHRGSGAVPRVSIQEKTSTTWKEIEDWTSPNSKRGGVGNDIVHVYNPVAYIILKSSTDYRVVIAAGSGIRPAITDAIRLDPGSVSDWSLAENYTNLDGSNAKSSHARIRIQLNGYARDLNRVPDIMVSNIKQAAEAVSGSSTVDYSQTFTTGLNRDGYRLTRLYIAFQDAAATGSLPIVEVLEHIDARWTRKAYWTSPNVGVNLREGEFIHEYHLSTPARLKPSTNYRVVVYRGASMNLSFTKYTDEDVGSASGWSIENGISSRKGSEDTFTVVPKNVVDGQPRMAKIKLIGYNSKLINVGIYDHSGNDAGCGRAYPPCKVLENGDIVVYQYEQDHANADIVTYFVLGGYRSQAEVRRWVDWCDPNDTSKNPFFILPDHGAGVTGGDHRENLLTRKTHDFETEPTSYCITLNVQDFLEDITTSQRFIIKIVDSIRDRPIQIRDAPQDIIQKNSMTTGKRDVQVCWVSPYNVGKPNIESYDIWYRKTTNPRPEWTTNNVASTLCRGNNKELYDLNKNNWQHVSTRSHTILALDPSTEYEVRVRAKNSAGVNEEVDDWSPHLTFTTGALTTTQIELVETSIFAEMLNLSVSQHDESLFTFELHFSEDIPGLGYRTIRNDVLQTRNARITGVRRLVGGSNQSWMINILPTGSEDVEIIMPITTDCTDAGAICVEGRMLSTGFMTLVLGPTPTAMPTPAATPTATPPPPPTPTATPPPPPTPTATPPPPPTPTATPQVTPLTAEFRNVPSTHDGTQIFSIELHFSENIRTLSYVTVRDSILHTTNARIKGASRITSGSNQSWYIKIQPTTTETITVTIKESTDCIAIDTVCADDNRKLSNTAIATIQY